MGMSENSEKILLRFKEICKDLNMDNATVNIAWDRFEYVLGCYRLEGDPLHWLACALYFACRQAQTPTVDQGSIIRGNCISLTRLLRHCKISIQQFLNKSKSWAEMTSMPPNMRKKNSALEKNVVVSMCIFKKYHIIFNDIFLNPIQENSKQHRSRKQRNVPCTPSKIFDFIWSLFVCIKGEFAMCSDDLVTSYHLLLACMDLAFNNALLADRRDLLNPQFEGLPSNWNSSDYKKPTVPKCIIDTLCVKFDGLMKDAKWVKEYSWKQSMKKMFEKNILQGDETNFTGLFDQQNFDTNLKSVIRVYEEYVLNIGELDEKIFLAEYRRWQLLIKQHKYTLSCSAVYDFNSDDNFTATTGIVKEDSKSPEKTKTDDENPQQLQESLISGRFLRPNEQERHMQLTSATQRVIRLQTLLNGCLAEPSETLLKRFNSCTNNPIETVKQIIDELGNKFIASYASQPNDQQTIDFANRRLLLSKVLYWKLVENVIEEELIIHPDINLSELLQNPNLHHSIFGVSIEIVIYAYNSLKQFPWILNALDLKGYYFYRVIEIIVRNKDHLPRDIVHHLNSIEEQILEHIAWKSDSPLWAAIQNSGMKVPSCEDSSLPNQLENGVDDKNTNNNSTPSQSVPQSPISSVADQFQSPVECNSKKKLFVDSKVKPGQSLLQNKTMVLLTVDDKGNKKYIPVHDLGDVNVQQQQPETPVINKPKRQGSLAIFFRKFYKLTCSKLSILLNQLNINDTNLKRKIFTCFEHTIVENTELMKDRHLDQILMCSIYVVLKVTQNDKSFSEIMHCYRSRSQYQSHVYRSVLISRKPIPNENVEKQNDAMAVDTLTDRANPLEMVGISTTYGEEERGDLIKFYNSVYITKERDFAIRFSSTNKTNEKVHLSPLPVGKSVSYASPKRRINGNVFVSSLNPNSISPSQVTQYVYSFSLSPSKDLKNINRIINSHVGKRLLNDEQDDDDITPIKKPHIMTRKLQGLMEDRLEQTKD